MSEFDSKAREWDNDKMHMERSVAIASELEKIIPSHFPLRALEYGAGTGILFFLLKDHFSEMVLMDSSKEMIKVCEEKKEFFGAKHIKPLWYDLEQSDYEGKFDIIFTQMVMHHVTNTDTILKKFLSLLNPGGILCIADLFSEDGSFHGPEVKVHHGFDPSVLGARLLNLGFAQTDFKTCFVIKRPTGIDYPVFLLTAARN